jgi:hypothetical protein
MGEVNKYSGPFLYLLIFDLQLILYANWNLFQVLCVVKI